MIFHILKNYFATIFSVFSFQFSVFSFSKNKLYPNGPLISSSYVIQDYCKLLNCQLCYYLFCFPHDSLMWLFMPSRKTKFFYMLLSKVSYSKSSFIYGFSRLSILNEYVIGFAYIFQFCHEITKGKIVRFQISMQYDTY